MRYLDIAERSWPLLRRAFGSHGTIYRATGGLVGHRIPGFPPFLLLDHVGAKSGKKRTTPLLYVKDDGHYIVVASKGGHPKHPAWFHNVRVNPDTTIQVGRQKLPVHARVARPEERGRLWAKAVAAWRSYDEYQERTDREIPLIVLEPR